VEFENSKWVVKEPEENSFGLWMYLEKNAKFELQDKSQFKFEQSRLVIDLVKNK
jgi:hypothetical protein